MGAAGRSRKTGSSKKGKSALHKRGVRKKFHARHIDQVWEDVRKPHCVHTKEEGPLGTTDRTELDEDLPAHGQHYCIPCSRYFISETALETHNKTKPHKKRVKELEGYRPHNKADAEWAAGMGPPDNGTTIRNMVE